MIYCGVSEPEEQTIACYLGELKRDIHDKVQLQPYILGMMLLSSLKNQNANSHYSEISFQYILLKVEVSKLIMVLIGGEHIKLKFTIKLQKQKKMFFLLLLIHIHLVLNISNVVILDIWLPIVQIEDLCPLWKKLKIKGKR